MSIVRVDIGMKNVSIEELRPQYRMLGARGLVSTLVADEVNPGCDPLGRENKVIFAPGLLGGTIVPSSSRTSLGTKSPLTGGIKESSAGGPGGADLAKLGINALIIEGYPQDDRWYYLKIDNNGTQILPADDLVGLGCYDTSRKLRKIHGEKCSVFVIGQAGEMKMLAACVSVTDKEGQPTRQFGRGGIGAVLGSKHIKAIVLDSSGCSFVEPLDKNRVKIAIKAFTEALMKNPVSGNALPKFGTAVLVNLVNSFGAFPTRSFSAGSFEGAHQISGETMTDLQTQRGGKVGHACTPGCIIRCSNIYVNHRGEEITGGFEYESICLLGSNLGIDTLDEIAYLNRLCDDYGLDTIEVGAALGIAMEAGILKFGDVERVKEAVHSIARGDLLGKVLGQGARITGQVLGSSRIPIVKGQAMAAYDPRIIKGMGALYATSPMGADHTTGPSCTVFMRATPEEQVTLAKTFQVKATAMENTGLCRFCCYALFTDVNALNAVLDIIEGYYGIRPTADEFWGVGNRILAVEWDFNRRAGLTSRDDRLPEFMKYEALYPKGEVFDITDEELDSIIALEQ